MRKVAPSGLQRCTQVKGATNKCPRKKRTFHTITNHQNNVEGTLHMSGTHLPIFAQSQLHNQEFSSPNIHPNWQKSKKTRGVGWEKLHKKLSPESNDLYLAYNMTLRVLYRPPPSTTLSSHCVHRCGGAHCAKNTTPPASNFQQQRREGRSFFLSTFHPFARSFSL